MNSMEKLMKRIINEVVYSTHSMRGTFVLGSALNELERYGDSNISQICNDLQHKMLGGKNKVSTYKSKMTIDGLLENIFLSFVSLNGEPLRDKPMAMFQVGVLLQVMIDRLDDIDEDVVKRCIDIRDQLLSKKEVKKYVYSR